MAKAFAASRVSTPGDIRPGRYVVLDLYRFIAAMAVVVYHFNSYLDQADRGTHFVEFPYFVDFFFVLSGYIIAYTYGDRVGTLRDYGVFLWRRLARIYPLHILTLLPYLAIGVLVHSGRIGVDDPGRYDFASLPAQLTLTHAWGVTEHLTFNQPSWSISAEWFLYLLFPALLFCTRRLGWAVMMAAAAAIIGALVWLIGQRGLPQWSEWMQYFGNVRALPSFMAGIALFFAIERHDLKLNSFTPGLVAFAVSILAVLAEVPVMAAIALFVLAIGLTAMAERAGAPTFLRNRISAALGDASYAVYMCHAFAGSLLLELVGGRILHLHGASLCAEAVFVGILVVFASITIFLLFETPARRFINSAVRPGRTAASSAA